MKLTVFLILLGLLRVSAVTNAQVYRINLNRKMWRVRRLLSL